MKNQGKHGVRNVVVLLATLFVLVAGVVKFAPFTSQAENELSVTVKESGSTDVTINDTPELEVKEGGNDVSGTITWSYDPSDSASVEKGNKVSFKQAGKIKVTATVSESGNEKTGSIEFTVKPVITTTSLNPTTATIGTNYTSTALTAQAGTSTVTWSLKNGSPSWLTIGSDGVITGKPPKDTTETSVTVTVVATVGEVSAEKELSLTISKPDAATDIALSNNTGNAGETFTAKLTATSTTDITWSFTGTLPDGLTLSNDTISGTPSTAGKYTITAKADNGATTPAAQSFDITIKPVVKTTTMPTATVGTAYSEELEVVGAGTNTPTWTITDFPTGEGLTQTGAKISGTPTSTTAKNLTFKAKVTVNSVDSDEKTITLPISLGVEPTGVTLKGTATKVNADATTKLTATVTPNNATNKTLTWTSSDTSVATVSNDGTITGVAAGDATITAETVNGKKATYKITVVAKGAPVITTDAELTAGAVGSEYSVKLAATGDATLVWKLKSGTMPSGLALNDDGTIKGTPTAETVAAGVKLTIEVSNSIGTDSKEFILKVAAGDGQVILEDTNAGITKAESSNFADYAKKESGSLQLVIDPVTTNDELNKLSGRSDLRTAISKHFAGVSSSNVTSRYMDISVEKTSGTSKSTIGDTGTVIEINLTVKDEVTKRTPYIFRYHDDTVTIFKRVDSRPTSADKFEDGTYYYSDEKIYLYSRYFSGYAIAYPTVDTWTVSFETNGGTAVPDVIVERDGTISNPTTPTKTGFTFEAWYTDVALTQKWDRSAPITANTTLYAGWKQSISRTTTDADGLRSTNSPQTFDVTQLLALIGLVCVAVSGAYIISGLRKRK